MAQTIEKLTDLNPKRYTVVAGDSLILVMPDRAQARDAPRRPTLGVQPAGGASVAVARSVSPPSLAGGGNEIYVNWPAGTVTADTVATLPTSTIVKVTVSVAGQAVIELAYA